MSKYIRNSELSIRNLSVVVACGANWEIGDGENLLWHLPKDMKFFKKLTWENDVIMGRKTYESIPKKFRPLENRTNIVITRNENYQAEEGVIITHSLQHALEVALSCKKTEKFIIGGGEIYKQSLPFVDTIYLTLVHETFPKAKVFFPELNLDEWDEVKREKHNTDERNRHSFSFITLKRKL